MTSKNIPFRSMKIDFVPAHTADPNKMLHYSAFYLGLHCLSKYSFKAFHSTNGYSETCLKRPLSKRPKIDFQDQLSLNAGQKYSAIRSTFIKLPYVIKIIVLSIFEWLFYTGFTVLYIIPIVSSEYVVKITSFCPNNIS